MAETTVMKYFRVEVIQVCCLANGTATFVRTIQSIEDSGDKLQPTER